MRARTAAGVVILLALSACRQDMHDQPRYKPLAPSEFFTDGRSARVPVAGTVAQGDLREDTLLYTGRSGNAPSEVFPFPVSREVLERGRERYEIFCVPCHSRTGDGRGIIVERGFRQPPSFHEDRLRQAPPGHFFDVITNGYGAMTDYASRVPPRDRWAITAYIRALQLSQSATLADVPEAERSRLKAAPAP